MDYKQKYEQALDRARTFSQRWQGIEATDSELALKELKEIFPELKENENLKIKRDIQYAVRCAYGDNSNNTNSILAWLEKQGEQKPNPYSGISFEHNGNTWGMCARDNGVDILLDKQLFKHLARQDEQKPAWNEEDERMLGRLIKHFDWEGDYRFDKNDCDKAQDWLRTLK